MALRIDLSGKIIGQLTVISYFKDKKWLCKCSCGNERLIFSSSLRKGKSHCGCKEVKFPDRFKDLTGKIFDKLIVLNKDPNLRKKRSYWICKCECGNESSVRGSHLSSGQIKSCGCKNSEDLTDKKFGKLKVLKYSGKCTPRGRSRIWLCKCECGNEKLVSTANLKTSSVKSCGCLFLDKIENLEIARLKNIYAYIKSSAKNRSIDFDLSIEDIQFLIDDNCHYCNEPPKNEKFIHSLKNQEKRKIIYQGVDRKNSKIGYTKQNCLPCCSKCNKMKLDLNEKEWIERMKKIIINMEK